MNLSNATCMYVCMCGCTTHGAVIGSTCECSDVQAQKHISFIFVYYHKLETLCM